MAARDDAERRLERLDREMPGLRREYERTPLPRRDRALIAALVDELLDGVRLLHAAHRLRPKRLRRLASLRPSPRRDALVAALERQYVRAATRIALELSARLSALEAYVEHGRLERQRSAPRTGALVGFIARRGA